MKKILIIGCPGSGKSTFARRLAAKTGIPLHHLDMIWHKPDKTTVSTKEFDECLNEVFSGNEWIIDGNYLRTLPWRLTQCDTVFFFDLPMETCLAGAERRLGMQREDMPWVEDEMDPEFRQWIIDFPNEQLPKIKEFLKSCDKDVVVFESHEDADRFLDSMPNSDCCGLCVFEVHTCKQRFMNLLLIGDEQESMIDRYISNCRLFIGYVSGRPSACCAVTVESDNVIEIKNLAVLAEHRRKGVGRSMLEYVEALFRDKIMQLGTGETPSTLQFYRNCGYVFSHRVPDFFTLNYDHPIVEEGVMLKDMVYLRKTFQTGTKQ